MRPAIDLTDVVWVVAIVLSVIASACNVHEAGADRRCLRQYRPERPLLIVARITVRREGGLGLTLLLACVIGVGALTSLWKAPGDLAPDLLRLSIRAAAGLTVGYIVLVAALDWRARHRVLTQGPSRTRADLHHSEDS
jgi:hypothetical protein